jgi:hypothetical protein
MTVTAMGAAGTIVRASRCAMEGMDAGYRSRVRLTRGDAMKRIGMLLALVLMAVTLLSGCVVVPLGGWYGHGYGEGGYYHHYGSHYYRGR